MQVGVVEDCYAPTAFPTLLPSSTPTIEPCLRNAYWPSSLSSSDNYNFYSVINTLTRVVNFVLTLESPSIGIFNFLWIVYSIIHANIFE